MLPSTTIAIEIYILGGCHQWTEALQILAAKSLDRENSSQIAALIYIDENRWESHHFQGQTAFAALGGLESQLAASWTKGANNRCPRSLFTLEGLLAFNLYRHH